MATVADAAAEVASIESAGAPSLPADTASNDAVPSVQLREDQIVNAISFLTNPKVAPASTEQKRSFLIKKGLTAGEIDEAFRRAPDAPAAVAVLPAPAILPATGTSPYAAPSQPGQQQAYLPTQQVYAQQPQQQPQQPGGPYQQAPVYSQLPQQQQGAMLTVPGQPLQVAGPPPGPRWTSVVLGLTAIAAGGYGLQRLVVPWLREYYERWAAARQDGKDPAASTQSSQALTAGEQGSANALADAIKAQTERMEQVAALLPALQAVLAELKDLRKQGGAEMATTDVAKLRSDLRADVRSDLRSELRTFVESINELSASAAPASAESPVSSTYGTPQRSAATSPAPSRGSQQEHGGGRTDSYYGAGKGATANGSIHHGDAPAFATPAAGTSASTKLSRDDILEMLQAGITPPGIRTDIVDTPPDPSAPLSAARLAPRAKPWERAQPTEDTPPAFAQQAGVAPWQRDTTPPQVGRAVSVASSVSDIGTDEAQPWRPPAVPQPSIPLPRRRPAASPAAAPSPDHGSAAQGAAAVAAAEPLPGLPPVPRGPSPAPATPEQTVESPPTALTPARHESSASLDAAPVTPDVENARAERDVRQSGASSGSIPSDHSERQPQTATAEATSEITAAPMEEGEESAQHTEED